MEVGAGAGCEGLGARVEVGEGVGGGEGGGPQPGAGTVRAHLTVGVALQVTVRRAPSHDSHRAAARYAPVLLYGESDVEHRVALTTLATAWQVLKPDGGSTLAVGGFPGQFSLG